MGNSLSVIQTEVNIIMLSIHIEPVIPLWNSLIYYTDDLFNLSIIIIYFSFFFDEQSFVL